MTHRVKKNSGLTGLQVSYLVEAALVAVCSGVLAAELMTGNESSWVAMVAGLVMGFCMAGIVSKLIEWTRREPAGDPWESAGLKLFDPEYKIEKRHIVDPFEDIDPELLKEMAARFQERHAGKQEARIFVPDESGE